MKINTPEESGKLVLQIFKQYRVRANEILLQGHINAQMNKLNLNADDVNLGLVWLMENKYVYIKSKQIGTYYLSDIGFEEL